MNSTASHPFAEPVLRGTFLRRYKRFFVDVDIGGVTHTAHTANTGAMTGLLIPGAPVILTQHDKKTRKLPLELEAIHIGTSWVVVNTIRANHVAAAFISGGIFPEVGTKITGTEVTVGDSRVDFQVGKRLVEVKSVTLRVGARGLFPDARSERALKHARLLLDHATVGAAALFLCQRTDIAAISPAAHIDPDYTTALKRAAAAGVEMLAAKVGVEEHADGTIALVCAGRIPVEFP